MIQRHGQTAAWASSQYLSVIDTGINRFRIFRCHLPERIFNDSQGVMFIAHHERTEDNYDVESFQTIHNDRNHHLFFFRS